MFHLIERVWSSVQPKYQFSRVFDRVIVWSYARHAKEFGCVFDMRNSLVVYSARICCVKEIYCSLRSCNLHIHFLPFHQENARDDIASFKKELAVIR